VRTLVLITSFQDSLGKLVPKCQTILDCAAARDDGSDDDSFDDSWNSGTTTSIPRFRFTDCMPLSPNLQCQSTEGIQ